MPNYETMLINNSSLSSMCVGIFHIQPTPVFMQSKE